MHFLKCYRNVDSVWSDLRMLSVFKANVWKSKDISLFSRPSYLPNYLFPPRLKMMFNELSSDPFFPVSEVWYGDKVSFRLKPDINLKLTLSSRKPNQDIAN